MKRYWVFLLVLLTSAAAFGKDITVALPSSGNSVWVGDTIKTNTVNRLRVFLPQNATYNQFWLYVYTKVISAGGGTKHMMKYRPIADEKAKIAMFNSTGDTIKSYLTVKLDTVNQGSKPITVAWRNGSGGADSAITIADSNGQATYWWSMVPIANQSLDSTKEEFRPPPSREWEFTYYGTVASDTYFVATGIYVDTKKDR